MLPLRLGDPPTHTERVLDHPLYLPACIQTSTMGMEETKARMTHFSTQRIPIKQICQKDVKKSPSFPCSK